MLSSLHMLCIISTEGSLHMWALLSHLSAEAALPILPIRNPTGPNIKDTGPIAAPSGNPDAATVCCSLAAQCSFDAQAGAPVTDDAAIVNLQRISEAFKDVTAS